MQMPPTSPAGSSPHAAGVPGRQPSLGFKRIAVLVLSSIGILLGFGLTFAGGTALVLDLGERDSSGYLMSTPSTYSTKSYALVSDSYRAGAAGDWFVARDLLGTIRIQTSSTRSLFVGIASEDATNSYLRNVARAEATRFDAGNSDFRERPGAAPTTPPAAARIWATSAVGTGERTLTWTVRNGNWRIVVMNADGTPNVATQLSLGARFPHLLAIGIVVLSVGLLVLALFSAGFAAALRSRGVEETAPLR
jgi:hypothetical protein